MDKILSIVIPTFNMEKYLQNCLSSLIVDDPKALSLLDVVIINDGSTDKSLTIAQSFEERYNGVFRVIDKENGNYGSCINRGLKEAAGKYIKILDADDSFETSAFQDLIGVLCASDSDCILTDMAKVDEQGNPVGRTHFNLKANSSLTVLDLMGGVI